MRPDLIIVGGGIAGAPLAIMLGRAGLSVALFEKRRFPSEKPCGEGIMPAGVGVLERLGLARVIGGAPFSGVRWYAGDHVVEASFPRIPGMPAFGLSERRLRLDHALFEAARATPGVTARAGVRVDAPIVERGRVVGVVAGGASLRAPLVVAADGAGSRLRRALGLEARGSAHPRIGVRAHFRLAPRCAPLDRVRVFLGDRYELYVTPLPDGEALVAGLAEGALAGTDVKAAWFRWIDAQPALRELLVGAFRISAIAGRAPLAGGARAGFVPGAVLLGDAESFTDPITGGGMAQALLAAELLAAHVLRARDSDDAWLARFDRQRRRMLRPHRLLTAFLVALVARPRMAREAVRLFAAHPPLFAHLIGMAGGLSPLL